MKVFLAGATGFVGSAVLKKLAGAGHEIHGLIQDASDSEMIKAAGGIPVVGDLLVPHPWEGVLKECDAVISASSPYRIIEELSIDEANRRAEAHAEMMINLVRASARSRVKTVVLSFHVMAFGTQGDRIVSELLTVSPIGLGRAIADAYWDIEKAARRLDIQTIEVFPGWVYGAGSWFRHYVVDAFMSGNIAIAGAGNNYMSLVHLDDLAEAYRLILDKMPVGERYCIADSHPVRQNDFMKIMAELLGKPVPPNMDYREYAATFGEVLAESFGSSIKVTNIKAKNEIGFRPEYDDLRQGLAAALRDMGIEPQGILMQKAAGY